jgi:rhodanese-related sulfurtransferase
MPKTIDARTLKARLSEPQELALLDVREIGPYSEGHPFFAIPVPYSRFEADLARLVPRMGVPLVLFDGGDGLADKAARRAEAMGYGDVGVLAGGAPAWKAAGYTLYEGVNVPSKAFGEVIEIERHTPRISARDLVAMTERGENMVIVDGRTWAEYRNFNIPGGISCPNAELPLRIDRLAPDPKTKIVVNCAGRTRSIIGAQTLIDFGVPNEVVALENGTQAWWLEGLQVERGADRQAPGPNNDAALLVEKRSRARAHANRHGVRFFGAGDVSAFVADDARTTFLFDIREAHEHAAGHLPGFVHAPGGQLVQATDQWVGVRGARIVVADGEGEAIRAPMTAAWLRQLGHDACVMIWDGAASAMMAAAKRAPVAPKLELDRVRLSEIAASQLASRLANVRVIDLRASADYRRAHVPGAVWSIRPRLAAVLGDASKPVVLVADDPNVARLATLDIRESGIADVAVLAGGMAGWQNAGQPVEATPETPPDAERIDFVFHTLGRNEGNLDAARAYLKWEIDLTDQLDAQERGSFRI